MTIESLFCTFIIISDIMSKVYNYMTYMRMITVSEYLQLRN